MFSSGAQSRWNCWCVGRTFVRIYDVDADFSCILVAVQLKIRTTSTTLSCGLTGFERCDWFVVTCRTTGSICHVPIDGPQRIEQLSLHSSLQHHQIYVHLLTSLFYPERNDTTEKLIVTIKSLLVCWNLPFHCVETLWVLDRNPSWWRALDSSKRSW